jgi:hypothetical protein
MAAAACAVIKPPPGGPEDKTPPFMVGIFPTPDSTGVARDVKLQILFSEKLDSESFKNRVQIYPSVEFDGIKVKDNRLEVSFREELPETTLCVVISSGYQDYHRVQSKEDITFCFSTADSIDKGSISGRILFKGKPDTTGVVKLFRIVADTVIDVTKERESRVVKTARDGSFRFYALPTDGARFILWAFTDASKDGKYAPEKEFSMRYPDTLYLTETYYRAEELTMNIIDPNEPGRVMGDINNETGIDSMLMVRLDPILPGEKAIVAMADTLGHYLLMPVPPGGYTLSAFIDIEPDSICGRYTDPVDSTATIAEPCYMMTDTLYITPGEEKGVEPVTLKREGG